MSLALVQRVDCKHVQFAELKGEMEVMALMGKSEPTKYNINLLCQIYEFTCLYNWMWLWLWINILRNWSLINHTSSGERMVWWRKISYFGFSHCICIQVELKEIFFLWRGNNWLLFERGSNKLLFGISQNYSEQNNCCDICNVMTISLSRNCFLWKTPKKRD